MAQALSPSARGASHIKPWRRPRHRPWATGIDTSVIALLFGAIPSLPRPVLARLTERLIDRLDELDGDADLESRTEDDEDSHDQEHDEGEC
ncbi:MAG: hypothetical protein A4S12_07595 [Proteobacteria bacterium SG_bin5]|nr:hypothetical protein [Hyphomicrobiales bacterium]OQW41848.1 MAG: hypothetical protein A4S12_07595 [Proteobacteria bacterium SG_bin5]